MRNRLLFLVIALFITNCLSAQLIGTETFLQGAYLEVGIASNGAFGTGGSGGCTPIPAGYHAHCATCGYNALAHVYDWGHDGWLTGAPTDMGDYSVPGTPFEGWEMQVNGVRSQAMQGATPSGFALVCPAVYGPGAMLAGVSTGYSNIGGRAIGTWTGTAGGLAVKQETRVDWTASWVVVTTTFKNPTATTINGVYYLRSTDPDNTQTWPGGGFPTTNTIIHQNEDTRHRVLVRAVGWPTPTYDSINSYFALATKDCRAKCFSYSSWPISTATDLATVWTNPSAAGIGAINALGTAHVNSDFGFGLVYNLGNIAPGDSASISYSYIYKSTPFIDSALTDPRLKLTMSYSAGLDSITYPLVAVPNSEYDTIDLCLYPGITTLPVDILYGDEKDWLYSKWTWSPGTGLSATTGAHVTINTTVLPPISTYTITGTDPAKCLDKIFYLTIHTCNGAVCNAPCVGDTLFFNAPGDSVGATYKWYGPAPSTAVFSTSQANFRFPATLADTGTYTVIKTLGGLADTSTTHASIFALPVLSLTSNIPICGPMQNPLNLFCSPDSVCTSFLWTGPAGFTSTLQNPSVAGFDSSKAGVYIVTAISDHGCENTNSIHIKPAAVAAFTFDRHPGCPYDTLYVANTTYNANVYSWNWNDGSTANTERNPAAHMYVTGNKVYTVILTVNNAYCTDTEAHVIDMRHGVTADFAAVDLSGLPRDTICNGDSIIISDLSTATKYGAAVSPLFSHFWEFGDGKNDATNGIPASHTYANEGIYSIKVTVTDSLGCLDTKTRNVWVLQPYTFGMGDTTICLTQPLEVYNWQVLKPNLKLPYGYTYSWSPATGLSSSTVQQPLFNILGVNTYTQTATLNHFGCIAEYVVTITSILPKQIQNFTPETTILYGNSIRLNSDSELYYMWVPNDGSLSNPNINNPLATPSVTTTYVLYGMDFYGCRDTASVTIHVDSTATEFIPTGFTPNGDGRNDVFRISGSKFNRMVDFRVYNRWGQQVFYTTSKEVGWDGTFEGQPQEMGVYHYSIIVAHPGNPENLVYKGDVTLIR